MFFFFFNDTATTEIYTLSLHDALPIFAFARCPIRVAQGIRNVLWPMTFRRREAQRAGRQTVEDLGKDGATFSERCHFEPMEEIPALHSRRTVNQPRCEDWHLKCRRIGRFACGTTMPHRPAYGHQARDAAQPSLRSCRPRNRSPEITPFPCLLWRVACPNHCPRWRSLLHHQVP